MSAVIPTNIIMRRHRRSTTRTEFLSGVSAASATSAPRQRRQRRVSDVSGLLFASDFPKFGEEPNPGIGPPSACSHYFEYTHQFVTRLAPLRRRGEMQCRGALVHRHRGGRLLRQSVCR